MYSIGTGRFADFARRYLGLPGDPPVARQLVPDLNLTLGLDDRPDFAFLQGERLCMGHEEVNTGVGDTPGFQFSNPNNSGILCTVESITVLQFPVGLGDTFFISGITGVSFSTATTDTAFRDSRYGGATNASNRPACQLRNGLLAGGTIRDVGVIPIDFYAISGTNAILGGTWRHPLVLAAGAAFGIASLVARQGSFCLGVVWRERPVLPTEIPGGT